MPAGAVPNCPLIHALPPWHKDYRAGDRHARAGTERDGDIVDAGPPGRSGMGAHFQPEVPEMRLESGARR